MGVLRRFRRTTCTISDDLRVWWLCREVMSGRTLGNRNRLGLGSLAYTVIDRWGGTLTTRRRRMLSHHYPRLHVVTECQVVAEEEDAWLVGRLAAKTSQVHVQSSFFLCQACSEVKLICWVVVIPLGRVTNSNREINSLSLSYWPNLWFLYGCSTYYFQ